MRVRSLASYAWRSPTGRNKTLPNLSRHKETKGVEGSVTRLGQLFGQIIERLSFPMDDMYLTSLTRILTFITWIFVASHKIFSFIISYLHFPLQELCNKWIPDYFTLKTFVLDIYAMVWNKLLVKLDTRWWSNFSNDGGKYLIILSKTSYDMMPISRINILISPIMLGIWFWLLFKRICK